MDDIETIVRVCGALAVDTRVRILALLREGPRCVGALASRLEVSQSAVSQHLRILRDAGLVSADRQGYYIHYRLNEDALQAVAGSTRRLFLEKPDAPKSKRKGVTKPCATKNKSARNRKT